MIRRWFRNVRLTAREVVSQMSGRASENYQLLDREDEVTANGWLEESVAARQDLAYQKLLDKMYEGEPRKDLQVAAETIRQTGVEDPAILEVGCGSGYYREVFENLLDDQVQYIGTDFSESMIRRAVDRYPADHFFVSTATALPMFTECVDITFNGNALMHIPNYGAAIEESSRVAREWCVFHSVPTLNESGTIKLKKDAYGKPTVELLYNIDELKSRFREAGLSVEETYSTIDYQPARHIVDEEVRMLTFLCRVA